MFKKLDCGAPKTLLDRAEYIILSVVEGILFKNLFQSIGRDT